MIQQVFFIELLGPLGLFRFISICDIFLDFRMQLYSRSTKRIESTCVFLRRQYTLYVWNRILLEIISTVLVLCCKQLFYVSIYSACEMSQSLVASPCDCYQHRA